MVSIVRPRRSLLGSSRETETETAAGRGVEHRLRRYAVTSEALTSGAVVFGLTMPSAVSMAGRCNATTAA